MIIKDKLIGQTCTTYNYTTAYDVNLAVTFTSKRVVNKKRPITVECQTKCLKPFSFVSFGSKFISHGD
uniref:Uncharacterized protein n=1 Tax=Octopus bimaculoides TaxID=37653 RepID=A0A0L8I3F8_OCTBM